VRPKNKSPQSSQQLGDLLRSLRHSRHLVHVEARKQRRVRKSLSHANRLRVLEKTGGRCHICGGDVKGTNWQADHVLAHSANGAHSIDNFLPAHKLCNTYRWDLSSEELQWALKIGVWARRQMERDTSFGLELLGRFFKKEVARQVRALKRKPSIGD
jgi:hypothetical protein